MGSSRYTTRMPRMPVVVLCLITLVFGKLQYNKMGYGEDYCSAICSDGRGYYAWLPALFIYHDLNFAFFEQVEVKDATCGGEVGGCVQDYRVMVNNKPMDKYYPGTALMMMPFFGLGHIITKWVTSLPANGYSRWYFIFIGWSGLVYFFLGMSYMLSVARMWRLSTGMQIVFLLLVSFGTCAMYFTVDKPAYSHIYSFAAIAAFVYYSLRFAHKPDYGRLSAVSLLAGLIFIIRPVNLVVCLILLLLLNRDTIRNYLFTGKGILAACSGIVFPFIMLVLYKTATGHFFVYSYGGEAFYFLHPHIAGFLFSFDNGVIPYTPLLFMPLLLCLFWIGRSDQRMAFACIVVMALAVYIHSSWWCWWYGFSFGARTMLDLTPIAGILLLLSLRDSTRRARIFLVPVYALCCALTLLLYHRKSHGYLNEYPIHDYWQAIMAARSDVQVEGTKQFTESSAIAAVLILDDQFFG